MGNKESRWGFRAKCTNKDCLYFESGKKVEKLGIYNGKYLYKCMNCEKIFDVKNNVGGYCDLARDIIETMRNSVLVNTIKSICINIFGESESECLVGKNGGKVKYEHIRKSLEKMENIGLISKKMRKNAAIYDLTGQALAYFERIKSQELREILSYILYLTSECDKHAEFGSHYGSILVKFILYDLLTIQIEKWSENYEVIIDDEIEEKIKDVFQRAGGMSYSEYRNSFVSMKLKSDKNEKPHYFYGVVAELDDYSLLAINLEEMQIKKVSIEELDKIRLTELNEKWNFEKISELKKEMLKGGNDEDVEMILYVAPYLYKKINDLSKTKGALLQYSIEDSEFYDSNEMNFWKKIRISSKKGFLKTVLYPHLYALKIEKDEMGFFNDVKDFCKNLE